MVKTGANSFRVPKDQCLTLDLLRRRGSKRESDDMPECADRYSCFWARNAIYHSLQALGVSPGDRVLVPAYICQAAVEPIAAYGAIPDFYAVQRNCEPVFPELVSKIALGTRALLAVHYFGFPQQIGRLRELCDRYGLALIEDCAHVLRGTVDGHRLGTIGDAGIFSWRKFLPVYDGGELLLNMPRKKLRILWSRESALTSLKVAVYLLDQMPSESVGAIVQSTLGWAHRLREQLRRRSDSVAEKPASPALNVNSLSFDRSLINFPMTRVSKWVMAHLDISSIVERRRSNYALLGQRLSAMDGVTVLFPEMPVDVCPWVMPMFIDGIPDAHLALRRLGIPAVTWGGVRPPAVTAEEFPDADFLYQNLVFLPIHQSLRSQDLELIVQTVREIVRKRGTLVFSGNSSSTSQ